MCAQAKSNRYKGKDDFVVATSVNYGVASSCGWSLLIFAFKTYIQELEGPRSTLPTKISLNICKLKTKK